MILYSALYTIFIVKCYRAENYEYFTNKFWILLTMFFLNKHDNLFY